MSNPAGGSRRRGSRSPVVMPSSELDAHLHTKAAQITKNRTAKVAWNFVDDEPAEEQLSTGCRGDDLMTPPDVLLQLSMKEAEKAADLNDPDLATEHWVRCTALARIVHGDAHWVLAKTHIQLARAYQQLKDLHQQALMHATKGRDILLSPSGHMTSHDPDPESIYQLSLAHCIVGKALTHLEKLPEAEKALIKAEKCSEKFSKLASSGGPDIQLDLDIVTGMGQLSLKQKKYELAKDCFTKALDYTKAAHGVKCSHLTPLLRSLATAEIQTSNSHEALRLLEEALQIAEQSHGTESLPVAEILVGLSRANRTLSVSEESTGVVEEQIERALSIYTSQCGSTHEATIACKDELCQYLSSHESSRTRAEEVVREVIVAKKKTFGETSQEVGHSYKLLATIHLSGGKITQARKYLEKARHVYSLSFGAKHAETQSIAKALEVIAESNGRAIQSKRPIFKTTV